VCAVLLGDGCLVCLAHERLDGAAAHAVIDQLL
jgi:hypothetical protein